jgi:hypothetical protein
VTLTKAISVKAVILVAVLAAASVSICCLARERWLSFETKFAPKSAFEEETITIESALRATLFAANDSNWASYIAASDLIHPQQVVTGVRASWVVPTVNVSAVNNTFTAVWIGIGGYFDNTLIQVGTEQDSFGDRGDYFAWFELLPQFAITIDTIAVSPGDQMNASIQLVNPITDQWSIYLEDVTTGQAFQNTVFYSSYRLSAEWIVERPTTGRQLSTLADVGTVVFNDCQATVGGQNGSISRFPSIQSVMYEMVHNTTGIVQLAAVSDLVNEGSSFSVETSPSKVPEFPVWAVLPMIMGTALLVVVLRKRRSFKKVGLL